jgi:hypothetical protein
MDIDIKTEFFQKKKEKEKRNLRVPNERHVTNEKSLTLTIK